MDNNQIKVIIQARFPGVTVTERKQYLSLGVDPGTLHELALFLRNHEQLQFDFLVNITGVDWGTNLGVVYHMTSTRYRHFLDVQTRTSDRETPAIDSVTDIWQTADFHEREVFDFFGIRFNNHPDMRRIFLDDIRIEGYPFRKDYIDEINIVDR